MHDSFRPCRVTSAIHIHTARTASCASQQKPHNDITLLLTKLKYTSNLLVIHPRHVQVLLRREDLQLGVGLDAVALAQCHLHTPGRAGACSLVLASVV